jgi:hypothetical protein
VSVVARLQSSGNEAALHLGMAVRAEQDALRRLFARYVQATGHSVQRHTEAFLRRIHVMERESADVTGVPAKPTAAARLLDEYLLYPTAPRGHAVGTAARTAVVAARLENESD